VSVEFVPCPVGAFPLLCSAVPPLPGSWSGVVKGIDWVTAHAKKPAVADMSLGGGANPSVDDAVKKSANSGVFYALAAGNSGADACSSSPARAGSHNGVLTEPLPTSTTRKRRGAATATVWTSGPRASASCRREKGAARPRCRAPRWPRLTGRVAAGCISRPTPALLQRLSRPRSRAPRPQRPTRAKTVAP